MSWGLNTTRNDYGWIRGGAQYGLPAPILQLDFGANGIVPTIGPTGTYINGTGSFFFDSASTASFAGGAGQDVPITTAYHLGSTGTNGSFQCFAGLTNQILQSEAPATTWTAVGTPTITNGVGTFFGGQMTYGTINGVANDGIQQSSGLTSASRNCNGSFYASVSSGTLGCKIVLEGDSGGSPQTQTSSTFTATTTIQRFSFYATFTSGATGNVRLKIQLTGTGTLRIGGMQLEDSGTGGAVSELSVPTIYIKTTAATATHNQDQLNYPTGLIAQAIPRGSLICWVNTDWANTDIIDPNEIKNFFSMSNNLRLAYRRNSSVYSVLFQYGSASNIIHDVAATWSKNTWYFYAVTWNNSGSHILSYLYQNGTLISSNITDTPSDPTAATYYIGSFGTTQYINGLLGKFKMFPTDISASEVSAFYNQERSGYGV